MTQRTRVEPTQMFGENGQLIHFETNDIAVQMQDGTTLFDKMNSIVTDIERLKQNTARFSRATAYATENSASVWYDGSGLPDTSYGKDGDYYLQIGGYLAGDIYKKTNSTWERIGNIKGDKGDIGLDGPTGPRGLKGDKGEQGDKGDKGDKGDQGTKGDNGLDGRHGSTWFDGSGSPNLNLGYIGDYYLDISNGDIYSKKETHWERVGSLVRYLKNTDGTHTHSNLSILESLTQSNISFWNNKVDRIEGKQLSTEDFTTSEKNKLSTLSNYTHPATHPASLITGLSSISTTGNYEDLINKPNIPVVTNDLTAQLKTNYDNAYLHSQQQHAPSNANANVQSDWNTTDTNNDSFIKNKPTIPLVDVTKLYVDTELGKKINSAGHVLTDNNYTTAEKTKLAGLNNYTHPSNHPASIITQDTNNKFVTDAEKTSWNAKMNEIYPSNLSSTVANALGSFKIGESLTGMTIGKIIEKLLCVSLTEPTIGYIWHGRIPATELGVPPVIQYNQITASNIKNCTALTKTEPKTIGKTSMGLEANTIMGDYIIIVIPKSTGYVATKDNGFGSKVPFDEETAGANGIDLTIDGTEYKVYGEMLLAPGEIFIYVD